MCFHFVSLFSSSSRHWIYACFCFSLGRGHARRHLGASHSSHLLLEYKIRDYQSCHTLVKMGHTQKREQEHVSFISYPASFGYYKSARETLLHVPDVDQHIQIQLVPQEYKVLKPVINRWSVSKLYSYYLIFPTAEIPIWLLASNAFRPMSNVSHLNKKSCCIRISASQHLKGHPGKQKKKKKKACKVPRDPFRREMVSTEPWHDWKWSQESWMPDFLPGARGPSSLITEGICPVFVIFWGQPLIHRTGEDSAWKKTVVMHPSRNVRVQVWEEIQEQQLAMMHSKSDWWPLIWCGDLTAENVSFEDGGFLSSLPSGRQDDERILSIRPLWQGQADCADSSLYTMGEKHIRKCP